MADLARPDHIERIKKLLTELLAQIQKFENELRYLSDEIVSLFKELNELSSKKAVTSHDQILLNKMIDNLSNKVQIRIEESSTKKAKILQMLTRVEDCAAKLAQLKAPQTRRRYSKEILLQIRQGFTPEMCMIDMSNFPAEIRRVRT